MNLNFIKAAISLAKVGFWINSLTTGIMYNTWATGMKINYWYYVKYMGNRHEN